MERNRLIEHVIEHYVARDRFRVKAQHLLQRQGLNYSTAFVDTRYQGNGITDIDMRVVHRTRESLKKCKHVTLDHLHDLLHADFMLDEDEHVHDGEDLFNFVIQEDADAATLRLA